MRKSRRRWPSKARSISWAFIAAFRSRTRAWAARAPMPIWCSSTGGPSSTTGARPARTSTAWCATCSSTRSATTSASPTRTWSGWRRKAESSLHQCSHTPAEFRQELALEPRMTLDPGCVAPARMRQREEARQMFAPGVDRLGHRAARTFVQVILDGVGAHEQRERNVRQTLEDGSVPARRALLSRRQVAAVGVDARIAEGHTDDRDAPLVVESLAGDAQPLAQAVAAAVVEGESGHVHARARRLAHDQQAGARRAPYHRPRSQRQMLRTDRAGAHLRIECVESPLRR